MRRLPDRSAPVSILAGLHVALLAGLLVVGCGGDKGKDESAAAKEGLSRPRAERLSDLDLALQPLRREFEEASGKVRLVAIVAPTCGHCQEAVDLIHAELLTQITSEDLEIFIVWVSILPTDVRSRALRVLERWTDPRGHHYWDDNAHFARAAANLIQLEGVRTAYDIYLLYGRNDTWDPEAVMIDEPADYRAVLEGWTPGAPDTRMTLGDRLRLPRLRIPELTARVNELLAEPIRER